MTSDRLAGLSRRVLAVLESRRTSFWVIGAWLALTLVWVVPFQLTGQSKETVRAIAEEWFALRAVYIAVGVTTLLCAVTRLMRDLKRMSAPSPAPGVPTEGAAGPFEADLDMVSEWLSAHHYTTTVSTDSVHAVRNRYSLLGGSVFHFGLVLFGVALGAHLLTVNSVTLRITEGQQIGEAASASGETVAIPSTLRTMTLESIRPNYYRDVLLFTRLDARLRSKDGTAKSFSLARPYWAGPTTMLAISDFNLAPHIRVEPPVGKSTEHVVAMSLSPPGTEDAIDVPGVPVRMSIIAYPDHGIVDGRDVSLSYNMKNPAFLISIQELGRTGRLLARELVRLEQPVTAEGYAISISRVSRYGTFRLVTAPALPFMALSLLAMTAGVLWRFGLRRSSVVAWRTPDGLYVDGWLDIGGRAPGREHAVARFRQAGLIP